MKFYELIPVGGENLWYLWNDTYLNFNDARIESLINYRDLYSKPIVKYDSIAYHDGTNYRIINTATDLKTIAKQQNTFIMMKTTNTSAPDLYEYKNKTFTQTTNPSSSENLYQKTPYIKMAKTSDGSGQYTYDKTNHTFKPREKAITLRAIRAAQAQDYYKQIVPFKPVLFRQVMYNGEKMSGYDYNDTFYVIKNGCYVEPLENDDKKNLYQKAPDKDYFIIHNDNVYLDINCLGYREGFYNYLETPLLIYLNKDSFNKITSIGPLYFYYNNKLPIIGDTLTTDDFIQVVQNPLAGYAGYGTADSILFTYVRDLGLYKDNITFSFSPGIKNFYNQPVQIDNSASPCKKKLYFIQPETFFSNNIDVTFKVDGWFPSMGFMPMCYCESNRNNECWIDDVFLDVKAVPQQKQGVYYIDAEIDGVFSSKLNFYLTGK